jgi:hypothetical protein
VAVLLLAEVGVEALFEWVEAEVRVLVVWPAVL